MCWRNEIDYSYILVSHMKKKIARKGLIEYR